MGQQVARAFPLSVPWSSIGAGVAAFGPISPAAPTAERRFLSAGFPSLPAAWPYPWAGLGSCWWRVHRRAGKAVGSRCCDAVADTTVTALTTPRLVWPSSWTWPMTFPRASVADREGGSHRATLLDAGKRVRSW